MHLKQEERRILMEGMVDTMNKCIQEIDNSQKVYTEKTKKTSKALLEQKSNIQKLADSFNKQAKFSPWVFQKCSLRGLYIAK